MIVPLKPPLEGITAERFLALALALSRASKRNSTDLQTLLEDELVTLLIADGPELHARLLASRLSNNKDDDPLAKAISPYLQLATTDVYDEITGLSILRMAA